MATLTLIVKPVGDRCPLRCNYCYNNDPLLPQRQKSAVMTEDVLRKMTWDFLAYKQIERPTIIWHGGEPTLAGIGFYEKVKNLQGEIARKLDVPIPINRIQTSGVLIDEEWATFLKEKGFSIGISIDGPEEVHNAHRKYHNGNGSYSDVMRGVEALNKHKVPVAAGSVVTRKSLENPGRLFEFFTLHFSAFEFSPYFGASSAQGEDLSIITPLEFASFTMQVFDFWWELDNPRIRVKTFRHYVEAVLGYTPKRCSMSSGCHKFLSVDGDGKVYPCGRLAGLPEFCLGNLASQNFEEIQNSEPNKRYLQQAQYSSDECKKCKWYYACHNGCTAARYTETSQFLPKSPMCEATKLIYEHVASRVNEKR